VTTISLFRGAVLTVTLTVAGLAAGPVPAALAQPTGDRLVATVNADDPVAPVLVLANQGDRPCQVATTSLGTVVLTRVEQGGEPVPPILFDAAFDESLEWSLRSRLHTLAPGESYQLPLRVVPVGPTGQALETVAWSASSVSIGSFHPVRPDQPLVLELRYEVPVDPEGGAALCGPADSTAAAGLAERGGFPWLWLAIAAAGLLASGAVVLLVADRRRRRSRSAATATGLAAALLVVLLAPAALTPRPATAVINVPDSLADDWAACQATFSMAGGDPAGILPGLNGPDVTIHIVPADGDETHHSAASKDEHFVFWDPDDDHTYFGSGGKATGCDSLYHELFHAHDTQQETIDHSECVSADGPSGIPISEVNATRAQNLLRDKLGLPQRSHYGNKPLPGGDCLPPDQQPPDPQCSGEGCGDSHGDPHLRTFDGRRWSFQAVGEFVAARDPAGGFEVQARQEPVVQSRRASVNTAVAMDVAGDRVQVGLAGRTGQAQYQLTLTVDGQPRELAPVTLPAGGEVELVATRRGPTVMVSWPDGSALTATAVGRGGIRYTLQPVPGRAGVLTGLLGDFDGDSDNDIRPAGGEPVAEPTFEILYPGLADTWRVDEQTSLFTYLPGTGPADFVDRSFPDADLAADRLPNREAAEAVCRRFGVRDPALLATCIIDVALTGLPDFAAAAAASQAFVAPPGEPPPPTSGTVEPGQTVTMAVAEPGGSGRLSFDAEAGQKVFVEVPTATLPNSCGSLELHGPDGSLIATGCVINGEGYIDGVVLPTGGEHTLTLDPPGGDTGEARLRLLFITDQQEPITPDGPGRTAEINQPGVVARFQFNGTAGERVFVDVPSTSLPNECSPLRLVAPDGSAVANGCLIGGSGHVETATLPATGRYTVEVDPRGPATGQATVRVYATTDETGALRLDGPAVTTTITAPGDEVHLTFAGTAGQRVLVEAASSTLPNACGALRLVGPDGDAVATGCVIGDGGGIGRDEGVRLPTTGEYTVVVDPPDRDTGAVRIRLRS
jgi:hypothetical protein